MPLQIKDRVKETSATTGTGTLTLAGATTGFRTFASALSNGDTTYYAIQGGADWEVGVGTYSAGTLARTTILSSSNAGAAVNFSAGTKDVFITMPANKVVNTDTGLPTTSVSLSTSGSPSDTNTLQDFIRHSWSTGMTQPGALTPNAGAGTVTIAASDFVTRQGTSEDSPLVVYRDAGVTNLAIAANDVSYVYRDYNGGSPTWTTGTSLSSFNGVDKVICYVVARNGTRMNIVDVSGVNVDSNRKNRRQKVEFDGFVYNGYWRSSLGKSSISATGLNILVGAGKYFYFDNPITHAAFNTTVAGSADVNNFITFYNRTGTWTQVTGQKAINNTQYDNAGTLTAFGGGGSHFRSDWVYVVLGSTSPYLAVVMGNVDYTSLAAAQSAPQPTALPPQFDGVAVLVGQVVAQKAVGTLTVQVAGTASFSGAAASSSHATLSSLDWPGSGHTSTAGKLAGFDGTTGVAADITVGAGLSLSGNTLTSTPGALTLNYTGTLRDTLAYVTLPPSRLFIGESEIPVLGKSVRFLNHYSESGTIVGRELTSMEFTDLGEVTNQFSFGNAAALTSLSFPALTVVGGVYTTSTAAYANFGLTTMHALTSLSMPVLAVVGYNFALTGMNSLTTLSLPALKYVGGLFTPTTLATLTTISLPVIESMGLGISIANSTANITTLTIGDTLKHCGGNVIITSAALNQASVDSLLVRLAALDGTNGTTPFSTGKTVTITGTSATPSQTGLDAKAILVGRGVTVTHN